MPPRAKAKSGGKAKAAAKKAARNAEALAKVDKKKPLFEQEEERQQAQARPEREKRARTTDECVQKCLRDNFPMFKSGQSTMLMNADGKTLYEVLKEDREKLDRGDPDAPTFGKHYYNRLRKEFAYGDSPAKKLKVADDSERLDEDLTEGIAEMNKHPKCFERMMEFLDSGAACNQRSFVLLLRQAVALNPHSASQDVVNFHMGVLKYIARHKYNLRYPAEWAAVRDHLDEAAVKALSLWKGAGMKAKLFWDLNRASLSLVLPEKDTDECMAEMVDFSSVEKQLCTVVQSSQVGNRLFGAAHRQYQGSKLTVLISSKLKALVAQNVTLARVHAARKEFVDEAAARGRDVKESSGKRTVELEYRGCKYAIVVGSPYDEYLMAEASLLESAAVETGVLTSLFCEDKLVPRQRCLFEGLVIAPEVVATAASVRTAIKDACNEASPSGEVIVNNMINNSGQYSQIHRAFRCTSAWWTSTVRSGSDKRLKEEVIACLDQGLQKGSVDEAARFLEELGQSHFISFCGMGLQSIFNGCKAFVDDVRHSRQPKFDGQNDTEFLKSVMEKVGGFFVYEAAGGAGREPRKVYGKIAAQAALAELRRKRSDEERLEIRDLNKLKVYSWLLETDELQQVDEWIKECIQVDIIGAAERAVEQAEQEDKKKQKKVGRKKAGASARDAVLKLLA